MNRLKSFKGVTKNFNSYKISMHVQPNRVITPSQILQDYSGKLDEY